MEIKGKTAVITGGASGLGEAVAERFAGKGANVVLIDINEEKGEALAKKLGEQALFVKTNIVVTEEVKAAIEAAMERFGHIDIVVNCAGIAPGAKVAGKKGPHDLGVFQAGSRGQPDRSSLRKVRLSSVRRAAAFMLSCSSV